MQRRKLLANLREFGCELSCSVVGSIEVGNPYTQPKSSVVRARQQPFVNKSFADIVKGTLWDFKPPRQFAERRRPRSVPNCVENSHRFSDRWNQWPVSLLQWSTDTSLMLRPDQRPRGRHGRYGRSDFTHGRIPSLLLLRYFTADSASSRARMPKSSSSSWMVSGGATKSMFQRPKR